MKANRSAQKVIEVLNEVYNDLNEAASAGTLSAAANEARLKCAEALRMLEDPRNVDKPQTIPRGVADAVRSATQFDKDWVPGKSAVQSYPFAVYEARSKCPERYEGNTAPGSTMP